MLTVFLTMILSSHRKEYTILLIVLVCVTVCVICMGYVEDIVSFLHQLEQAGNLNSDIVKTLIKVVGIGFLSEITVMICTDSGNGTLGKVLQMTASCLIIWLCIPLFTEFLSIINEVLNNI